jgi:phosphotransferase system  glucose/maltose/N-acetylglucosamine-specific IIC component
MAFWPTLADANCDDVRLDPTTATIRNRPWLCAQATSPISPIHSRGRPTTAMRSAAQSSIGSSLIGEVYQRRHGVRFFAALFACAIELILYILLMRLLGYNPGQEEEPSTRCLRLAPLVAIVGYTWSRITKRPFDRSSDPFGLLPKIGIPTKKEDDAMSDRESTVEELRIIEEELRNKPHSSLTTGNADLLLSIILFICAGALIFLGISGSLHIKNEAMLVGFLVAISKNFLICGVILFAFFLGGLIAFAAVGSLINAIGKVLKSSRTDEGELKEGPESDDPTLGEVRS